MFKNCQCFWFFKDYFLLHPLCYASMEVLFTCCYLAYNSMGWGIKKICACSKRGDSEVLPALAFLTVVRPPTFILKSFSALLCLWENIRKSQWVEIQQDPSRPLSCASSVNFLDKGYYVSLGMICEKYTLPHAHIEIRYKLRTWI